MNEFWTWLVKYPSTDGFKKLSILKAKYLNSDAERNIKYIHVTGTNGKGSVSRYLHAVLSKTLNLKVGLFTSPHILIVNERIIVNNEMISDQDLLRIKDLIIDDVDKYQLGFFSILTLIALIYFQEQKVDWAIIEVGIGGLFDSTNIIRSDHVVLTSIARDHSELLGDSLLSILQQKLGLIKETTKSLFVSGNITSDLKQVITEQVSSRVAIYFSKEISNQGYILENQTLAFLVVQTLFASLDSDDAWKVISETKVDLRFQVLEFSNKKIYLDVAHNVAGVQALIHLLKLNNVAVDQIIFSALKTKKPELLVSALSQEVTSNIYICQNQHHLSIKAQDFSFEKMILLQPENSIILVTGSCYFVSEVYQELLAKKKEYEG